MLATFTSHRSNSQNPNDAGCERLPAHYAGNPTPNYVDPTGLYQAGNPLNNLFAKGTGPNVLGDLARSGQLKITNTPKPASVSTSLWDFGGTVGPSLYTGATNLLPGSSILKPAVNAGISALAFAASGPVSTTPRGGGHHWVPGAVEKRTGAGVLTNEARKIIKHSTSGPLPYYHTGDTWNDISHPQYSDATESLLNKYHASVGRQLNSSDAAEFINFLEEGKIGKGSDLAKVLAANKEATNTVKLWRTGLQSITQGAVIRAVANEIDVKISNDQVKALVQYRVNGAVTEGHQSAYKSLEVLKVEKRITAMAQAGKLTTFTKGVLRKAAPALLAMSAANAYAYGSRSGHTGWLGAADQTIADVVAADLVEDYLLRPAAMNGVNFVDRQLGLRQGSNGRIIPNQRVQRAGFDANGFPTGDR